MGRLDYRSGRFDPNLETNQINDALRGYESEFGDTILYFRFWQEYSEVDDIFGEATGLGRQFHDPQKIPVIHATHIEGSRENREQGFYYNDSLYVVASKDRLNDLGYDDLDLQAYGYLKDRIVYDYRVFTVTNIQITGQIQERDIMASFEATEVKPDEYLNDPQFKPYVLRP